MRRTRTSTDSHILLCSSSRDLQGTDVIKAPKSEVIARFGHRRVMIEAAVAPTESALAQLAQLRALAKEQAEQVRLASLILCSHLVKLDRLKSEVARLSYELACLSSSTYSSLKRSPSSERSGVRRSGHPFSREDLSAPRHCRGTICNCFDSPK